MATINRKTVTLDATDKIAGRFASQIARELMGKTDPAYQPHIDSGAVVHVSNVDKMKFTGNKVVQKVYHHHSGHPGGLHSKTLGALWAESPAKVLRAAVSRMLPKNRHRKSRLLRLKIS